MTGWPEGYALRNFDSLDSTNSEARRLADAGEAGPLWIRAARQTAGRGRRGRAWQSQEGNLAATLLIRPEPPVEEWPQLSFVAAIAASDAVAHFAPAADVLVKWPNDVLADGRKIAGILLESGRTSLALGVGLNLASFPDGTEFPATSLAALGVPVPEPDAALSAVAANFAKCYEAWSKQGFPLIRDIWLSRAFGIGGPVRARLDNEERSGLFQGIDMTGALLLDEGEGRVTRIAAADIFPVT